MAVLYLNESNLRQRVQQIKMVIQHVRLMKSITEDIMQLDPVHQRGLYTIVCRLGGMEQNLQEMNRISENFIEDCTKLDKELLDCLCNIEQQCYNLFN